MQSKLLGFCAFLLFATFGILSGVAQAHHDEPIALSETIALQGDGLQRQEMSDEEKERRRQVCDNEEAFCRDWCDRSEQGQECYKKCWDKYVECLKKIPSNPVTDPDY